MVCGEVDEPARNDRVSDGIGCVSTERAYYSTDTCDVFRVDAVADYECPTRETNERTSETI